jgi:hypothetical protein
MRLCVSQSPYVSELRFACHTFVSVCASVDSTGRHGLSCRKSAGRLSRHSAVNELIKRALTLAEIPSRLEPTSLIRQNERRPDEMSLVPWKNGRCLAWDFTCPDTLAPSHLNIAINGPGVVAAKPKRKRVKYASLTSSFCFVPVAVETMGALGDGAVELIYDLGRRISEVTGERRATEFLLQRLSIAIQRGNAASVLGTVIHHLSLRILTLCTIYNCSLLCCINNNFKKCSIWHCH